MDLSLPFNGVLDQAESIINSLWTAYLVPIGLGMGFAILGYIVRSVKSAI